MDTSRAEAFEVLGIPSDSDQGAVVRAYRRLARVTHPDVSPDPDAADRFASITAAYRLASQDPPATSVPVRIHVSGPGGGHGRARNRPDVEDTETWGGPVAGSGATPVVMLWGERRERHAPIVAGPARVTPLPRQADREVRGG